MGLNEYIIVVGIIIVGIIFFLAVQTYVMSSTKETFEYGVQGTADRIGCVLERLSAESSYTRYCLNISLSDLKVEQGYLTFKQREESYILPVPKEVKNTDLKEIATVCFVHSPSGEISIYGEIPVCDTDTICTIDECKEDCQDCYGPDSICVGDGFCNPYIRENCDTSPEDCNCSDKNPTYICCPSDPVADDFGCVDEARQNLSKNKECFCNNECNSTANLTCNPTTPTFTDFDKACCPLGYGWNGSDCEKTSPTIPCDNITSPSDLPSSWDWRNVDGKNWMTPVRFQGSCGSCWAFSAVGAVEGTYNIEQNDNTLDPDLSEQDLVSCSSAGSCSGGLRYSALYYINNTGIVNETCFSYKADDAPCDRCVNYIYKQWTLNNYHQITDKFEIKKRLVCNGPLSVAIPSRSHAIVLVGYNDSTRNWIIKNSWGTGWQDGGYSDSWVGYGEVRYNYYVKGVNAP